MIHVFSNKSPQSKTEQKVIGFGASQLGFLSGLALCTALYLLRYILPSVGAAGVHTDSRLQSKLVASPDTTVPTASAHPVSILSASEHEGIIISKGFPDHDSQTWPISVVGPSVTAVLCTILNGSDWCRFASVIDSCFRERRAELLKSYSLEVETLRELRVVKQLQKPC